MAEFTPITTQEDFDKAIGERLKRERETVKKEYAGYLSPEDEKKKYEGYLSPAAEKEKYKGYLTPEEAAEKEKVIKGYEAKSVKMRIAHEVGIPYELAGRLTGENEEALRKDAEGLIKIMGSQAHKVPPLKSTEPPAADTKTAAFKSMLDSMKGE
ncbi:MAG: DUF4355 domain-containing protein [[Clostridium] symbiosum]